MSAVGSPERVSAIPSCGAVHGASTIPAFGDTEYSQADFDRDNANFRNVTLSQENILTACFSWAVYGIADGIVKGARERCAVTYKDQEPKHRSASIVATHLGIQVLDKLLLNAVSNPQSVLESLATLRPQSSEKIPGDFRDDMRRRAINIVFNCYPKEMSALIHYLVRTGQASTPKEALIQLTQNTPCGNLVDAVACQMIRVGRSIIYTN